ncbi:MAG: hypothetical protein ABIQ04_01750 [Candidatus Saccharimonadales bacterium]
MVRLVERDCHFAAKSFRCTNPHSLRRPHQFVTKLQSLRRGSDHRELGQRDVVGRLDREALQASPFRDVQEGFDA